MFQHIESTTLKILLAVISPLLVLTVAVAVSTLEWLFDTVLDYLLAGRWLRRSERL